MSPCSALTFMPAVAQLAVELVAADLRAHEDDRLVGLLGVEHVAQRVGLLARLDLEAELLDRVDGQRRRLHLHRDGVVEVAVGERADRGGMVALNSAVWRPGRQREDLLDVLEEAEVEHLVGLVEHDEAALVQDERVARDQVEHAADGPDDDVPARLAAAPAACGSARRRTRRRRRRPCAAVGAQRLRDLDAQLARRREHERLDLAVLGSTYSIIGSPKAAVLPEPVWAWPMMSRPSSSGGMACSWIGLGDS